VFQFRCRSNEGVTVLLCVFVPRTDVIRSHVVLCTVEADHIQSCICYSRYSQHTQRPSLKGHSRSYRPSARNELRPGKDPPEHFHVSRWPYSIHSLISANAAPSARHTRDITATRNLYVGLPRRNKSPEHMCGDYIMLVIDNRVLHFCFCENAERA